MPFVYTQYFPIFFFILLIFFFQSSLFMSIQVFFFFRPIFFCNLLIFFFHLVSRLPTCAFVKFILPVYFTCKIYNPRCLQSMPRDWGSCAWISARGKKMESIIRKGREWEGQNNREKETYGRFKTSVAHDL